MRGFNLNHELSTERSDIMPIKPVDFQVMLPKTSEVSKIHTDEQHKNLVAQQQQAAASQNKTAESLRQVHKQETVQQANIREKQEKNQKNKKGKDNSKKGKDDTQTGTIDIRL
jgi:hypothetical protein